MANDEFPIKGKPRMSISMSSVDFERALAKFYEARVSPRERAAGEVVDKLYGLLREADASPEIFAKAAEAVKSICGLNTADDDAWTLDRADALLRGASVFRVELDGIGARLVSEMAAFAPGGEQRGTGVAYTDGKTLGAAYGKRRPS
jgi:hypothetical protein